MPQQFMTAQEAEIFLVSNFIGQLATFGQDGYPYTVPIDYVYWEKNIYLHCALEGQKLENILHNPKVCFTVYRVDKINIEETSCKSAARYNSVQVFGKACIVNEPSQKGKILNAFMEHFAAGRPFNPITEEKAATCTVIEIQPERISGKRNIDPA